MKLSFSYGEEDSLLTGLINVFENDFLNFEVTEIFGAFECICSRRFVGGFRLGGVAYLLPTSRLVRGRFLF